MRALHRLTHQCIKGQLTPVVLPQIRTLTVISTLDRDSEFNLPEDSGPQGIQGDLSGDCTTFKLWLESCQRYGLPNCDQQLQGIQTGRKTLAEVFAEQDLLIASIAEQYRANKGTETMNVQGVQENVYVLPDINTPCPQGIQGYECERFKLWLENCHRFGFEGCMDQLKGFHEGRKSLADIFAEQEKAIREAGTHKFQQNLKQSESGGSGAPEGAALSARQKLQRAVKEYGSTVMIFHVGISLMSLGFFYTLVNSGIDVVGIMSRLGIGGDTIQSKIAGGTGTFVVAYAVHKVFAPARIATTLTATPLIVRYLRRIGFLKTPKAKPPTS